MNLKSQSELIQKSNSVTFSTRDSRQGAGEACDEEQLFSDLPFTNKSKITEKEEFKSDYLTPSPHKTMFSIPHTQSEQEVQRNLLIPELKQQIKNII